MTEHPPTRSTNSRSSRSSGLYLQFNQRSRASSKSKSPSHSRNATVVLVLCEGAHLFCSGDKRVHSQPVQVAYNYSPSLVPQRAQTGAVVVVVVVAVVLVIVRQYSLQTLFLLLESLAPAFASLAFAFNLEFGTQSRSKSHALLEQLAHAAPIPRSYRVCQPVDSPPHDAPELVAPRPLILGSFLAACLRRIRLPPWFPSRLVLSYELAERVLVPRLFLQG
ncbi:hypothetical protein F5Y12DRAFT_712714 [Xylaria sp. FL1777]|nr:hypothetical protein F5Y12DRAFT_712714 [Xylaria sp. FL1777]